MAASPKRGRQMRFVRAPPNLLPALKELGTGLHAQMLCCLRTECGRIRYRTFRSYLMRLRPVGFQNHAVERDRIAIHGCKTGNRCAAGTVKGSQKCSFTGKGYACFAMRKRRQQRIDTCIADTGFYADGTLSGRRREAFGSARSVMTSPSPRRRNPAQARNVPSTSPASSLRRRVSTFPRKITT